MEHFRKIMRQFLVFGFCAVSVHFLGKLCGSCIVEGTRDKWRAVWADLLVFLSRFGCGKSESTKIAIADIFFICVNHKTQSTPNPSLRFGLSFEPSRVSGEAVAGEKSACKNVQDFCLLFAW